MEVMTSKRNKRTILLIKENSEDASHLCKLLADIYNFMVTTTLEEGLSAVRRMYQNLSAVLIDSELPDNACELFLKQIRKQITLQAVPILVISTEKTVPEKINYLAMGATDFITAPYQRELIINRVSNAIHIKDSATFPELEKMLRALPANIYLKDAEGKYVFATHYWHHLDHDDDPDWTIRGKTDIEIRKDKENAMLAYQSDLQLLADGKERSYVIEINADNIQEYLHITKAPVRDENNKITGIIALINNVTEQELLKQELQRQAYFDSLTGLYNRSYYENYIQNLPEGCWPLSIISADCNDLKYINDHYGHLAGDEYIRISASLFRGILPKTSMMCRIGGDEFLFFLPQTEEEQALGLVDQLRKSASMFSIKDQNISISYGVYTMPDKSWNLTHCIRMADKNMYQDKSRYKAMKK